MPLYDSWLNIYFILTIRHKISSERFLKYEHAMHVIAILLPLYLVVTSTINSFFKLRGTLCSPQGKVEFWAYSLIFSACFLICIVSMLCICLAVLSQASKTRRYSTFNTNADTSIREGRFEKYKRKTIKQACLYTLAFFLTYSTPVINGLYTKGNGGDVPDSLKLATAILYPLQGFWNFMFYIRPGVQRVMKSNPEKSCLGAIGDVLLRRDDVQGSNEQV